MSDSRLCLITGASAGIGAALAREYARQGWDVALTARRADRLRALQDAIEAEFGVQALVFPADLSEPGAVDRLLDSIASAGRSVDGLVNNAGYGPPPSFLKMSWAEHQQFTQVLLNAPLELCHRVMPAMIDNGFGRVLNIASIAGFFPSTGASLYGAVKMSLVRATEALHSGTRETGVHVTALCPGLTHSEFHDVAGTRESVESAAPFFMWASATAVARAGYAACEANAAVRVTGLVNKTLVTAGRLLPDPLVRGLSGQAGRLYQPDA